MVDIAGLVKGAHEGQGLGNAFLSHIKACDALFHMLREYISIFSCILLSTTIAGWGIFSLSVSVWFNMNTSTRFDP